MATYSNVLAWRIPGTGERGGLPSVGSHRVGHDWGDLAAAAAAASLWRPTSSLDTGPYFVSLKYSQGFPKALLTLPNMALRNDLKLAAWLLLCLQ